MFEESNDICFVWAVSKKMRSGKSRRFVFMSIALMPTPVHDQQSYLCR